MGSLEYAQARLSARFGDRPDELAWRKLEHVRELPALLDVARTSAFRTWVGGISEVSTPHEIEATLRGHWRDHVAMVAKWLPDEWCPAVLWCGALLDVPVIAHLARGQAALPWMRGDPLYRDLVDAEPGTCPWALGVGPLAPLATGWNDPGRLAALWRAEWERRAPRAGEAALRADLRRALAAHLAAFHEPAVTDGWPLRRTLEARLRLLFRRATLDPMAVFAYVALIALDLERLRGEFLRRAAFPGLPLAA
jgi:hypothetical protein